MRPFTRVLATAALTAAGVGLLAAPAAAHVTVSPGTATQGGYSTLIFKVPNERDDASTTALEVAFPAESPLASVSVQPKPGWSVEIEREELDEPLDSEGGEVTDRVSRIIWTADEDSAIDAGEFETFPISAGPLPTDTDQMVFGALQTYSDGEVVRWIEEAAEGSTEEPDNPAPIVQLVAEDEAAPSGGSSDDASAELEAVAATAEEAKEAALEAQTAAAQVTDGPTTNQVNTAVGLAIGAIVLALIAGGIGGMALSRRDGDSNLPPAF